MMAGPTTQPARGDVVAAAQRLAPHVRRTPLLGSAALDEQLGLRLLVKAESLQHTGSFKFRGAMNALLSLTEAERARGVVACSSGNHAQGVAEAARLLGIRATIVMPADAPGLKIARTRRSGAEVILYDRVRENRDTIAGDICRRTGAAFVHPYETPEVIAGQGTCGLEIAEQLGAMELVADRLVVCASGGGLMAGLMLALGGSVRHCHVAEPAGFDDYARSLAAGRRLANERAAGSACDALLAPTPGERSFAICHDAVESGFAVSDAEVFAAMRLAFSEFKLVLEPGGAVALAVVLAQAASWKGETVVAVASGGNVDPALFATVLADG